MLVDAFAGSSGKAKMYCYLTEKYRPEVLCSTNTPNAGHTYRQDDDVFIAKVLPSGAYMHKIDDTYNPHVFIGPTAIFTIEQLLKEIEACKMGSQYLWIHPRAGIVTSEHKAREENSLDGPKSIASTCQGAGTYLADKILRRPGLKLARDYSDLLQEHILTNMVAHLHDYLRSGYTAFHEVSQGIGLDIHHGIEYPYCTSRSTNSLQAIADMAPPLNKIGDIYLNIHSTPIRVGNIIENNKEVGNSGPGYSDQEELTWTEVGMRAGMPQEEIDKLYEQQLTTVTKRLRRVFTFSWGGLAHAVRVSSATKLMVNFIQYVDWNCYKAKTWDELTPKVKTFIDMIEKRTGLPVELIGTGPNHDDIIDRQ